MSNKDIADILKCKPTQIKSWLTHRGIKRGKEFRFNYNKVFSQSDVNFIIENYKSMTSTQIGEILGFSKSQIDGKISNLGINSKRRKVNDNYFSKIDTPLKAYYIGFIFADGYIINNNSNHELGITLQSQDKYILDKLNTEIGGEFIIYHNEPREIVMKNFDNKVINSNHCDTIRIYSKRIVEDLISIGIIPDKSHNDIFPIVEEKYFFDFLRGYIDGDGCYYNDDKYTYMHITSASKAPLIYI